MSEMIDTAKMTKDERQAAFNSECAMLGQVVVNMDRLVAQGDLHKANIKAIEAANRAAIEQEKSTPLPEKS